MRKTAKRLFIALWAAAGLIVLLLPLAVPPLVERIAAERLAGLGFPSDVRMQLGYCWRNGPGLSGRLRLALNDSPWCLHVDFGASCSEWSVTARMDETAFSETDPVLEKLLRRFPLPAVSNLVFSGKVALDAHAERTFGTPVPVWRAKLPIRGLTASLSYDGSAVSVDGLSATPGASGIARHLDISPVYVRMRAFSFGGPTFSNFFASVRTSEKALLMTEAGADFCGGKVNLYSLYLNAQTLNTGFTLFADDIDAGEALRHVKGFRGDASGRLHGKIKLFVREGGKSLRLNDAFLYSTPGEFGKIRMERPEVITDSLALAGLDEASRLNVANALTDLDYSVLKLTLKRTDGKTATLSTRICGSATRNGVTAPVDLTLNFRGEIEQLINLGLDYSSKLKGNSK